MAEGTARRFPPRCPSVSEGVTDNPFRQGAHGRKRYRVQEPKSTCHASPDPYLHAHVGSTLPTARSAYRARDIMLQACLHRASSGSELDKLVRAGSEFLQRRLQISDE